MIEPLFTGFIYNSVDNDKSPNSCLATVEAFINFYVLRFILYPKRIISRYDEWPLLNTATKYSSPLTSPYGSYVSGRIEYLVTTLFNAKYENL